MKEVCQGISPLSTVSLQHGIFLPGLHPFQQPLEPFCAVTDCPKPLWAHQNKLYIFCEVWLQACILLLLKDTLSLKVPSFFFLQTQQVAFYMHSPGQSLANLSQGRMLKCCQGRSAPIPSPPPAVARTVYCHQAAEIFFSYQNLLKEHDLNQQTLSLHTADNIHCTLLTTEDLHLFRVITGLQGVPSTCATGLSSAG